MADSFPITFTGREIELLDRASDLDRSNEASGELRGKYIRWDLTNNGPKNQPIVGWTVFSGEDSAGRLIFSGVDRPLLCTRRIPGFGISIPGGFKTENRSRLFGFIELEPAQFAPSTKYKIGLSIRAKITPGKYYNMEEGRRCDEGLVQRYIPCVITLPDPNGAVFSRQIDGLFDSDLDISLDATTDAVDFNSLHSGQIVKVAFALLGKRIAIEKITLTKTEF
jgi:hypothetical protein